MILHRVSWVRVVGRVGVERGGGRAGGRVGRLVREKRRGIKSEDKHACTRSGERRRN